MLCRSRGLAIISGFGLASVYPIPLGLALTLWAKSLTMKILIGPSLWPSCVVRSRCGHYIFVLSFVVSSFFLVYLSRRRVDVWWTSAYYRLRSVGEFEASCKFQRLSRLGSVTARHSISGRQPNSASLNRGRHLYSAGWPSFAYLFIITAAHSNGNAIIFLPCGFLFFFHLFFFSSPNLSGRRLDVYHTSSTHGVALVRI